MDKTLRNVPECGDDPNVSGTRLETANKDTETATIYDLPRQVWLEIYEHLDFSSYLSLRLTCHHFLHLIDNYIGLRANLSQQYSSSSSQTDVLNFFSSIALNDVLFGDTKDTSKFNLERILAYPSYLNDVSFTGDTTIKLLQDIIVHCHALQLIEMTMDCKIIPDFEEEDRQQMKCILPGIDIVDPNPPEVSYLNQLECFKLVPGMENESNLRSQVVLSLLRATKSPNLRKVIFQCELTEEITLHHLLNIAAELLEKHGKLEAFFMAVLNEEFLLPESEAEEYPYLDLKDEQEREKFRTRLVAVGGTLKLKKMGLAIINPNMQLIWGDFLKTQSHLVHLSLTVNIGPNTFSQELFDSFSGTLEQLAIRGKFEEPFDFQYISNCRNLKEICLHNLQDNGGGGIIPRCVNMSEVPSGLESLILFQVVSRTEEIRQTLMKLDKLSTLVVFKCGHAAGSTGVGLDCLQEILNKRTLQSILIVQFICGSTTEAEKLAGVLFNMARDPENSSRDIPRRRHRSRSLNNNLPVPPNDAEHVLNLHPINGTDQDELIFIPDDENNPLERPVSRGNHRYPEDDIQDDFSTNNSQVSSEHSAAESELLEAAGESPEVFSENVTEIWKNPDVKGKRNEDKCGDSDKDDISLRRGVTSQLPESNSSTSSSSLSERSYSDEFPPLPNTTGQNLEESDSREDQNDIAPPDNRPALNMLQNILEHAMVDDPDDIERRNPHLQNHMVLNQLHEINDDVELILDVGDQDIGPVLDLFAAERLARAHNVQVGFILDGVIDIMNEDAVRSKWLCVEDTEGHLTYTLKISVEL